MPGGAGAVGLYPGLPPGRGPSNFPMLNANSFLPPPGTLEPPLMNFSGGSGMFPPSPPMSYPPMYPPPQMPLGPPLPPSMPYPGQSMMTMGPQPPFYDPGLLSYPRRRPVRICRRRRGRRSRRCRPVIQIIDSSSCSSLSSCTTISSCSRRRRRRSCSHSRRRSIAPQQPQQPIILLPIQTQQSPPALAAPVQQAIQQPQQIVLPPIQVQSSGHFQGHPLALSGIPMQQQPLALPPFQFNSSNIIPSTNSSPIMIPSGQPMIQPSISMPQMISLGPQQLQAGSVQYVQAGRQSSSPLQYISAEPRSTMAPQRVLVNSTNKKQSTLIKPIPRLTSTRDLPQSDLKYGRRPFDWYESQKKNHVVNENVRVGQRGSTAVG